MNDRPPYMPTMTPEQQAEIQRRKLAADNDSLAAYRVAVSDDGKRLMGLLARYIDGQPEPGRQTDAQAWHYLGQMDVVKLIRREAAKGAVLAGQRGEGTTNG